MPTRRLYEEYLQPCWVCGTQHQRQHTDKYFYFSGILVCVFHDGAKEWYEGALKMADERLKSQEEQ